MSVTNHGDIVALRKQLFASLERLSAAAIDPKEVERAKAIAETAQTIINSAKVEVDFIRATGGKQGSGFIPLAPATPATPEAPASPHQVIEQRQGVTVRRHRLEG